MAKAGDRVSEFVLESPVGRGAFGEVWRAHHHVWQQQRAAVKLPHQAEYIRQLQREGLAIQGLEHPNIVKAIGFDPFADPPYLVMEYVEGGSLRPMIQRREITVQRAVEITNQLLAALKYTHSRGIVHRDIKPENILLTKECVAKLTDFGVGRAAGGAASIVYSMSIDNGAGNIAGTLDYMSPEQRSGGEVDARSDLYAVGVVLFEMLTGEKPAGGEVPGDLNPSVPAYLNEAFRRAYARADKRFTSADEFSAALRAATAKQATPPRLPPKPIAGRQCPRCHRPVDPDDQFCMHCGVQLTPIVRRCNRCRAYPSPSDTFCHQCGNPLQEVVSSKA